MVSSVSIHAGGKGIKPCFALKWQDLQLFLNNLICIRNVEKSYSGALICPVFVVAWPGSLEACCYLPPAFRELLPTSGLEDLERQKSRANKCALPGVTQAITAAHCPCFPEYKGKIDILCQHSSLMSLPQVASEILPCTPCSVKLGVLKVMSANKLGIKRSL